ncbi:MAG: hypothetical protein QM737_12355 [Ferruginibacter sp.]
MEVEKLNIIQKFFLKYTNRPAYINYRAARRNIKLNKRFFNGTETFDRSLITHAYKERTSFKHSGNCGDIIYSLPAVWELAKNGKAEYYLQIDQPTRYNNHHPLKNVMLNQKMAEMLKPLLLYQPLCKSCEIYNGEQVDYDLDVFRKFILLPDRGNIARWYFNVFAVSASLSEPWLIAPKDPTMKDAILIARSHRYRNPNISYSFLQKYPNVKFIGVEEEFLDMKSSIPNLEHKQVNDFLEMATLVNSCKLFIGNQSFPFAIAEGLKTNRLLEVYYQSPNVIVEGKGGYDFLFQPHFELMVEHLLSIG